MAEKEKKDQSSFRKNISKENSNSNSNSNLNININSNLNMNSSIRDYYNNKLDQSSIKNNNYVKKSEDSINKENMEDRINKINIKMNKIKVSTNPSETNHCSYLLFFLKIFNFFK